MSSFIASIVGFIHSVFAAFSPAPMPQSLPPALETDPVAVVQQVITPKNPIEPAQPISSDTSKSSYSEKELESEVDRILNDPEVKGRAEDTEAIFNLELIANGLRQYYANRNHYPARLTDIVGSDGAITYNDGSSIEGSSVHFANESIKARFFAGKSYAISSDASHFVLWTDLHMPKNSRTFKGFTPASGVILGVQCSNEKVLCLNENSLDPLRN